MRRKKNNDKIGNGKKRKKVEEKNLRGKLFRKAYLTNGFNATRAYMKAFETDKEETAATEGWKLLRNPKIMSRIDKELTKVFNKLEIKNNLIIAGYINQAFCDIRGFFDNENNFIGMRNLNVLQQACIESVEVEDVFRGKGKDVKIVGQKTKIKFYSKKAALDSLAKYKGLIKDGNNLYIDNRKVNVDVEAAKELRKAVGDDRITELNKLLAKTSGD